jgi:DNA-binding transcriptional MerR regulator
MRIFGSVGSHVPGRLSVKEVAELAGVTPRTVRYYHSIGLLAEPPRDASGYRRYGGKEVVELVRIVRLRAVGMPLPQIAQRVSDDASDDASLVGALTALADELDAEITRLTTTRDRLRDMAKAEPFDQPVKVLTHALQNQGLLGPADRLRSGEQWAAAVLDALHPEGMPGLLAQASQLFGDSNLVSAIKPLRRRLRRLSERSTEDEIAQLAADVAALLPSGDGGAQVDIGLVDLLLTDRLNPTQQRFMHQLRNQLQGSR